MFSSRTDWPLTPNRLSEILHERRARGAPVLDLTESNPTRCGFTYDSERIFRALTDPRALQYKPDPRGLLSARQAVKDYYAERGAKVGADQIFLTTSTSEAYSYVFRLLANPGDAILVPQPSYPLFEFLAGLNDVEVVPYPLRYADGWQLDAGVLESRLGTRARAILVVHPNNPTGSFVRRGELEFLLRRCRECSLALIADEVFADYAFGRNVGAPPMGAQGGHEGRPYDSPAEERVVSHAAVEEVLTFTLSGLSKISGLPQMKLAWVAVNGPAEDRREALARLEVIADTYLSVSAPLAHALPELLELRHSLQPQIRERVESNLSWLDGQLSPHSAVSRLKAEGGWYAILKLPSHRSDEDWAIEILCEEGVLAHPGHFFDFPSEGHLVVSLLPPRQDFEIGVRKILDHVSQHE
jgi:aspartate/methionine/tyrosine aminotransferase